MSDSYSSHENVMHFLKEPAPYVQCVFSCVYKEWALVSASDTEKQGYLIDDIKICLNLSIESIGIKKNCTMYYV